MMKLSPLAILLLLCAACTSTVTNNNPGSSGSSGSTPVPKADCSARCEAKASMCGAPADVGKQACGGVCDGTYTSDQLACLEGKPCAELKTASLGQVCPASSSSSGGNTSGGNTSGGTTSGGTDHFSCSLNGACFKCNDSDGVSKCSLSTGPGPGCTKTDSSYCN
jgi:hypothetical protein